MSFLSAPNKTSAAICLAVSAFFFKALLTISPKPYCCLTSPPSLFAFLSFSLLLSLSICFSDTGATPIDTSNPPSLTSTLSVDSA